MFMFFSINEANKILPDVIKKFNNVSKNKDQISKIEKQLQSSVMADKSFKEFMGLKQELNTALVKFYESIVILENTGVYLKSIEQGLLDFPSKRFDEEVWLCWKHGETSIKFWHEKEAGFMGRKPIQVNDESLV